MPLQVDPWFDGPEDYYDDYVTRRAQLDIAYAEFKETYGCRPDNESITDAQRIAFWESSWQICEGNTALRKQCLRWMKDMGVSVTTSEGGGVHVNISRAIGGKSGQSEEAAEFNTSSTNNNSGVAQISINTEFSMSTSVSDRSSQFPSPISQEHVKQRDPPNMSKGKPTTKEQFAFKDKSVSDDWPDLTQTAPKDEVDTNTFLLRRLQHWKDILAAKKHPSPDNEDEQDLPSDILDFNGSMLSREDYDDLRASAMTKKRPVKVSSNHHLEQVSSFEQATATNALLYGLTILKAATPTQQHEMVTSLLHPRARKVQPSLPFEINALLLELDTQKLLTMSVDEDALHTRAKKVARTWGIDLSSLEDGPGEYAW